MADEGVDEIGGLERESNDGPALGPGTLDGSESRTV